MILIAVILTKLRAILVIPVVIWSIISIIMILKDNQRGRRALTSWDWIKNYSPKWHKLVTFFIILPLLLACMLCSIFSL